MGEDGGGDDGTKWHLELEPISPAESDAKDMNSTEDSPLSKFASGHDVVEMPEHLKPLNLFEKNETWNGSISCSDDTPVLLLREESQMKLGNDLKVTLPLAKDENKLVLPTFDDSLTENMLSLVNNDCATTSRVEFMENNIDITNTLCKDSETNRTNEKCLKQEIFKVDVLEVGGCDVVNTDNLSCFTTTDKDLLNCSAIETELISPALFVSPFTFVQIEHPAVDLVSMNTLCEGANIGTQLSSETVVEPMETDYFVDLLEGCASVGPGEDASVGPGANATVGPQGSHSVSPEENSSVCPVRSAYVGLDGNDSIDPEICTSGGSKESTSVVLMGSASIDTEESSTVGPEESVNVRSERSASDGAHESASVGLERMASASPEGDASVGQEGGSSIAPMQITSIFNEGVKSDIIRNDQSGSRRMKNAAKSQSPANCCTDCVLQSELAGAQVILPMVSCESPLALNSLEVSERESSSKHILVEDLCFLEPVSPAATELSSNEQIAFKYNQNDDGYSMFATDSNQDLVTQEIFRVQSSNASRSDENKSFLPIVEEMENVQRSLVSDNIELSVLPIVNTDHVEANFDHIEPKDEIIKIVLQDIVHKESLESFTTILNQKVIDHHFKGISEEKLEIKQRGQFSPDVNPEVSCQNLQSFVKFEQSDLSRSTSEEMVNSTLEHPFMCLSNTTSNTGAIEKCSAPSESTVVNPGCILDPIKTVSDPTKANVLSRSNDASKSNDPSASNHLSSHWSSSSKHQSSSSAHKSSSHSSKSTPTKSGDVDVGSSAKSQQDATGSERHSSSHHRSHTSSHHTPRKSRDDAADKTELDHRLRHCRESGSRSKGSSDGRGRFADMMYVEQSPNGGASVLHAYQTDVERLSSHSQADFVRDFLHNVFHEEAPKVRTT